MKRLASVFTVVLLLSAASALATPIITSLGNWNEGDPCTTHQFWGFTPSHVAFNPGDGYTSTPESVISPDPGAVVATISPRGSYNSDSNSFIARTYLAVSLELPNVTALNPYKVIWVDVGNAVIYPEDIGITAIGHDIPSTDYSCEFIFDDEKEAEEEGVSEFGIIIRPNPVTEKITMYFGPGTVLDYIHVDTKCVPEPATIAMLGFGTLVFLKKRRA